MSEINFPNVQRQLDKKVQILPAHTMKLWRLRPKIFFRDVMDVKLDLWQEECVELYMEYQRLALVASKGPGKTFTLAMFGWHFFTTGYQPKIAALSITKDHLKANLWAELLKWRARVKLLENSTNDGLTRITLKGHEGYSFIDARSFPKQANQADQASALAGLHADNVAFLIDEAGMIPDAVIATADAALSTGESNTKRARLLVTANPEEPRGLIYKAYMKRTIQKWAVYSISGDPDDPKRAPRVSKEWAQEQIDMYGRDHPWVMVNVLAKYPLVSTTKLIGEEDVSASMKRNIEDKEVRNSQSRLGADIARGGIDSSALARRRGLKAYPIELISSAEDGPAVASKIVFISEEQGVERVFVDNTGGYGSSVIDNLKLFPQVETTPVVYNSKAQDKRYYNKRTEMWIRLRDWIKAGGCLPNDPQLAEELLMPNVYFLGGVMRLEEKEQIKQRLGRSPDRADALAQTFADVEQASFYADYNDPHSAAPGRPHQQQNQYYSDESQVDENYLRGLSNYRS